LFGPSLKLLAISAQLQGVLINFLFFYQNKKILHEIIILEII
jgi:hypothetical protein